MSQNREFTISIAGKTVYAGHSYISTSADGVMDRCGVYLLRDADTNEIVYVGSSYNVCKRLKSGHHVYNPAIHVIEVIHTKDDYTRIWLEAVLVSTLLPSENKRIGVRLGESGGHLTETFPDYTKELEQVSLFAA